MALERKSAAAPALTKPLFGIPLNIGKSLSNGTSKSKLTSLPQSATSRNALEQHESDTETTMHKSMPVSAGNSKSRTQPPGCPVAPRQHGTNQAESTVLKSLPVFAGTSKSKPTSLPQSATSRIAPEQHASKAKSTMSKSMPATDVQSKPLFKRPPPCHIIPKPNKQETGNITKPNKPEAGNKHPSNKPDAANITKPNKPEGGNNTKSTRLQENKAESTTHKSSPVAAGTSKSMLTSLLPAKSRIVPEQHTRKAESTMRIIPEQRKSVAKPTVNAQAATQLVNNKRKSPGSCISPSKIPRAEPSPGSSKSPTGALQSPGSCISPSKIPRAEPSPGSSKSPTGALQSDLSLWRPPIPSTQLDESTTSSHQAELSPVPSSPSGFNFSFQATPSTKQQGNHHIVSSTPRQLLKHYEELAALFERSFQDIENNGSGSGSGDEENRSLNTSSLESSVAQDQHSNDGPTHKLKMNVCARDFRGQRGTSTPIGNFDLIFQSAEQAIQKLWDFGAGYIKHEVYFGSGEESVHWDIDKVKSSDDIDTYFTISTLKRSFSVTEFFHKPANYESETKVKVYIYRYGVNLSNRTDFKKVNKKLLLPEAKDRAGAPDNVSLSEMIATLKQKFGHTYKALDMNWCMWADLVLRLHTDERENFIANGPPGDLLHMFHPITQGQSEESVKKYLEKVALAANVNKSFLHFIADLLADCDVATQAVEQVKKRATAMQATAIANAELLLEMGRSMQAQENPISLNFLNQIQNLDDIDHQDVSQVEEPNE